MYLCINLTTHIHRFILSPTGKSQALIFSKITLQIQLKWEFSINTKDQDAYISLLRKTSNKPETTEKQSPTMRQADLDMGFIYLFF